MTNAKYKILDSFQLCLCLCLHVYVCMFLRIFTKDKRFIIDIVVFLLLFRCYCCSARYFCYFRCCLFFHFAPWKLCVHLSLWPIWNSIQFLFSFIFPVSKVRFCEERIFPSVWMMMVFDFVEAALICLSSPSQSGTRWLHLMEWRKGDWLHLRTLAHIDR